jgi:hypothetical protein
MGSKMKLNLPMIGVSTLVMFFSVNAHSEEAHLPHLDLEMTGEEYRVLTEPLLLTDDGDPLKTILEIGKRNLDWLSHINASRSPSNQLELSTPGTQRGIPITSPSMSNRTIVQDKWNKVEGDLPDQFMDIVVEGGAFSNALEMSDEDYLKHARLIDGAYSKASRWLLMEPHLSSYAARAENDVRGYYFLKTVPKREAKLLDYQQLQAEEKAQFTQALIGICKNAKELFTSCSGLLRSSVSRTGNALEFYNKYRARAERHWNSYFNIPRTRTDIAWNSQDPDTMTIPFKDPQRPIVLNWLRDNIEDEFQWNDWRLKLEFRSFGGANMTHVEFVPGSTPHVNGIAGSKITMDGNRNIQEYSSRWVIRHEYGHVLGFPDCYLEFYDTTTSTMINYQLDIDDLMCSRKGKFNARHFDNLKSAYFRD